MAVPESPSKTAKDSQEWLSYQTICPTFAPKGYLTIFGIPTYHLMAFDWTDHCDSSTAGAALRRNYTPKSL